MEPAPGEEGLTEVSDVISKAEPLRKALVRVGGGVGLNTCEG